jgi:glycosyltransferase involved in cell wall biosynthesis
MNVLMVISQFHPIIGGAENQARILGQALIKRGIDVDVVTGWWDMRTPRRENMGGLRVQRNFSFWGMFGIRGLRTLGAFAYMASLGLYLLVRGKKYDLIHVHQVLFPAFVSALIAKTFLRKPLLVKNACSGVTSDILNLKKFPFGGRQLDYLIRSMDCLVTVNEDGASEFKAVGYPGSKIVRISNGVFIPREGKTSYHQVLRVLTTARLDRQKGIDVLLKAWVRVVERHPGMKLVVLGQGPEEEDLRELSGRLGLAGSVEFPGLTRRVEKYLQEADLFVLSSRAEGLPNALLEALSYGIPCVATNLAGNRELLGGDDAPIPSGAFQVAPNGLLVNVDDDKGLSEGILHLIRNPDERATMGKRGRAFIGERYSIDRIADQYLTLYQRLLEGFPRGSS